MSPGFTLDNFISIVAVPAYLSTSLRTLGMASRGHGHCRAFCGPAGYLHGKDCLAPGRRNLLAVAITLPLWAGYLVKILAMRLVFTENGFLNWAFRASWASKAPASPSGPPSSPSPTCGSPTWRFRCSPRFARFPNSLFDASADMGATVLHHNLPSGLAPHCARHHRWVRLHLLTQPRRLLSRPIYRGCNPDDWQHHRLQHQFEPTRCGGVLNGSDRLRGDVSDGGQTHWLSGEDVGTCSKCPNPPN